jgi:hypothetical protein
MECERAKAVLLSHGPASESKRKFLRIIMEWITAYQEREWLIEYDPR